MNSLDEQYAFREEMVKRLSQDLLGPSAPDEVLDESPLDRYVTGILYPAAHSTNEREADEPDDESSTGDDAAYDPGVALARMKYPSSMGISLSVDSRIVGNVEVRISAGRYEALAVRDGGSSETDDVAEAVSDVRSRARRPRTREQWQRISVEPDPVTLDITSPRVERSAIAKGLELFTVVRPSIDGVVPLTVVLRNRLEAPRGTLRDAYCWLQPSITVHTDAPAIVDRRLHRSVAVDDEDLDSYDLLFRDAHAFAVGHGCAATWEINLDPVVEEVRTTFIPTYELPLSTPRSATPTTDLRMHFLATGSTSEIVASLEHLVVEYRRWISCRLGEIESLDEELKETARRHLADASRAAQRMADGIELISRGGPELEAFRLMNRAMRDQRARQDWIRSGATGDVPDGFDQAWRPFQIAFILLNLSGLADVDHEDRDVADLLWFPTGGGKTEAYLGLIAFTILLRRLRDVRDRGVCVIMRYTLRLLTLQQFERAATLICALEAIRSDHPNLRAAEPMTLGLWVGQGATPNKLSDARRGLNRLRQGLEPEAGNPMQLTRCPWCGSALDVENYRVDRRRDSLVISCQTRSCRFGDELPLYLVDEDVYRIRPSLLIGTVDKFALMAWQEKVRTLFATDGVGRGPDLIVQDELHLISGPLGTLVGLYEVAVNTAAGLRGQPKVVASTATIRRAGAQMAAVFDRRAFQFPPPGLDTRDSFFAVEAPKNEKGTRLYLGVLTPGTSQTTLLVRSYAALLQAAANIAGEDEVRDPYWTLVGYFNSLRVLGGAFMQVIDDVPDRIRLLAGNEGVNSRTIATPTELTSRIKSAEIPLALAQLAESYPHPNSPDVVLATNMISVGVDVDRLGLMAVMGQPQATAEYIQATSRVGRRHPGLVVVLYNAARSRDRSHYENFLSYHQTLYREVEATSATPFATRARDRGLHGVLVSLARLLISGASEDDSAGKVEGFEDRLRELADRVADRAGRIAPDQADETATQLSELIDTWIREARSKRPLRYASWSGNEPALLIDPGRALSDPDLSLDTEDTPWPTLLSLRDVDAESALYLIANYERVDT